MANSYEIKIGSLTFAGDEIESLPENNAVDIIGSTLSADECNAVVFSSTNSLFDDIARATPVEIYVNGALHSKYYFTGAERVGDIRYKITACSGIGLLDTIYHKGGMWIQANNMRFTNLVAEIVGGSVGTLNSNNLYPVTGGVFDCFIESALQSVVITGHLPYATARENLHWLLISYGVSLTKATNGDIVLGYLIDNQNPETISADLTYNTGSLVLKTAITQVQIEEHTFIDRGTIDASVVVFDSAKQGSANNDIIVFSEPYHNLTASGLTIHESNCNYARISGSGTLTGYKYTHSTRLVTRGTAETKNNVVSLNGVELINPINSANVADRLYSYYVNGKEVKTDFVLSGEMCGRQYRFTDPKGNLRKGYITKMDLDASGIIKAKCSFMCDYTPVAQGNSFNNAVILTGSGSWTVPAGVTKYRAILVGGGNGADGAYNGAAGSMGGLEPDDWGHRIHPGAAGGAGGRGSNAAAGGKVYTVDNNNAVSGTVINFACGAGGAGGARNGGAGSAGGATTFAGWSSANGSVMAGGIINLFTGEVYAESGLIDGINGADGGEVPAQTGGYDTSPYEPKPGNSLTYEGVTWNGGGAGGETYYGSTGAYVGGGGGGAAYGANGNAPNTNNGGYGGNGANAQPFPAVIKYGCGANGANGGGGGGGGGYYSSRYSYGGGAGGSGGLASEAQSGGPGCIVIYY